MCNGSHVIAVAACGGTRLQSIEPADLVGDAGILKYVEAAGDGLQLVAAALELAPQRELSSRAVVLRLERPEEKRDGRDQRGGARPARAGQLRDPQDGPELLVIALLAQRLLGGAAGPAALAQLRAEGPRATARPARAWCPAEEPCAAA